MKNLNLFFIWKWSQFIAFEFGFTHKPVHKFLVWKMKKSKFFLTKSALTVVYRHNICQVLLCVPLIITRYIFSSPSEGNNVYFNKENGIHYLYCPDEGTVYS